MSKVFWVSVLFLLTGCASRWIVMKDCSKIEGADSFFACHRQ